MTRTWDESKVKRDGQGQFADKVGSGSWLKAAADQADPQRRALTHDMPPKPGELPRGVTSLAGLLDVFADRKPTTRELDDVRGYLSRAGAMHDPKAGLRARIPLDRGVGYKGGKLAVRWEILDDDGKKVGEAKRNFTRNGAGNADVEHENFELEKHVQGGGFATRWAQRIEAMYRANGVDKITLQANIDVGGYAWAKQGYDFADHDQMQRISRLFVEIARRANEFGDAERGFAEDVLQDLEARITREHWAAGTAPTPVELAMLGWVEGAKDWTGKDFMKHQNYHAVKHMVEPAGHRPQATRDQQGRLPGAPAAKRITTEEAARAISAKAPKVPQGPDGYEIRDVGETTDFGLTPVYQVLGPDGQVVGKIKAFGSMWQFIGNGKRVKGETAAKAILEGLR